MKVHRVVGELGSELASHQQNTLVLLNATGLATGHLKQPSLMKPGLNESEFTISSELDAPN